MKLIQTALFITFTLLLFSCGEPQAEFVHSFSVGQGLEGSTISYSSATGEVFSKELSNGDVTIQRVEEGQYSVVVADGKGSSTFNNIPSKYINLDSDIEVSRNEFKDYFPSEWEAMKSVEYTSLYIKSKNDNQVFFIKTVYTNTDKEIGRHSEDY